MAAPLTLVAFRVVASAHLALVVAQPFLAGRYLSGDFGALTTHQAVALGIAPVSFLQVVAAVLYWRPGRGPGRAPVAAIAIIVAELTQITLGYARTLYLHVPLGVAIVAGTLALTAWSWTGRAQVRR